MSQKKKEFLDRHPEKSPYRTSHSSSESWPEKVFKRSLRAAGIFGWTAEYAFGRFSFDVAFPEIKVDVEIDGATHLFPEIIKLDSTRDALAISRGWYVYRIRADQVLYNLQAVLQELKEILADRLELTEAHMCSVEIRKTAESRKKALLRRLESKRSAERRSKLKLKWQLQFLKSCRLFEQFSTSLEVIQHCSALLQRRKSSVIQLLRTEFRDEFESFHRSSVREKRKVREKRLHSALVQEQLLLIPKRREFLMRLNRTKQGWIQEVAREWNVSCTHARKWIKKYLPELNGYQRQTSETTFASIDERLLYWVSEIIQECGNSVSIPEVQARYMPTFPAHRFRYFAFLVNPTWLQRCDIEFPPEATRALYDRFAVRKNGTALVELKDFPLCHFCQTPTNRLGGYCSKQCAAAHTKLNQRTSDEELQKFAENLQKAARASGSS